MEVDKAKDVKEEEAKETTKDKSEVKGEKTSMKLKQKTMKTYQMNLL